MSFEIVDALSWADIAFRVRGKNREELFSAAGEALYAIMLQNPEDVRQETPVTFECQAEDIELLLYDFLQEFLYFKDSRSLILVPQTVVIREEPHEYSLTCAAGGEIIDRSRHRFIIDIKAITMHNFSVTARDGLWTATVVVDV